MFAIVGPTGAGKTTLLDALCVALFDRTPRLGNRSTVKIGRGENDPMLLGAEDVRALLRRGASAGFAEVDFESGDARRYRARWEVRRARGASDGRCQNAEVTLTGLDDGERFGGTKTETLRAIHDRLGLSFDQFRRSALLAQGEFAAFLRADGKDRSELLERMTGTEIYSRLSIAAHARAVAAEQMVRDRRAAAAAVAVLSDDERSALAAEITRVTGERDVARTRHAAADHAARWIEEAGRRASVLAEASALLTAAQTAVDEANVLREELAVRRRAETLRAPWQSERGHARQAAIAVAEASRATAAASQARTGRSDLVTSRTRLGELHAPLSAARIAIGLAERPAGSDNRLDERARTAASDAGWLVAHVAFARELALWPQLETTFSQQAARERELADAAQQRAAKVGELRSLDKRRDQLEEELRVAGLALDQARRQASTFADRRGLSLEAAGKAEKAARRNLDEARTLGAIAEQARTLAVELAGLDRARAELATADAEDAHAASEQTGARDAAAIARDERQRAVADLRRVAGYSHDRATLVDGEPCPLCGALEHPWHARGAVDALVADAERRLGEAQRAHSDAAAALAACSARVAQRARERQAHEAAHVRTATALDIARTTWHTQLAQLGELALVGDPDTDAAAEVARDRSETAQARLDAAMAARSEAQALATAQREAQAAVEHRQVELARLAEERHGLELQRAPIVAAIERSDGMRATLEAAVAEARALIAAAAARWSTSLALDHALAASRVAFASVVEVWQARAERVAELDATLAAHLQRADRELVAIDQRCAELDARASAAEQARAARDTELTEAVATLHAACVTAGIAPGELANLLVDDGVRAEQLAARITDVERTSDCAHTLVRERERLVADHAAMQPASLADANQVAELARDADTAERRVAELVAALRADDDARARREAATTALVAAERNAEVDRVLGEVIGSHDGKRLRSFAQSLTLDHLLAVANAHLDELAPRYQLERVPGHDLELQVIDRELGDDVRSVQSLSGGESFLASLALALGLSSMSAHDVRVRTLLIDEGFGTLDPATLDTALAVLDALRQTGRQVGVISHVPALVERVGAHVRVSPKGGGRSEVIVA